MRPQRSGFSDIVHAIPPLIRVLIAVNVAIWIVEIVTFERFQAVWSTLILSEAGVFGRGWIWQLVTYQFLHAPHDIAHVLFNMFSLWMFGRHLEPRWGRAYFLAFYLVCGIGGGLLFLLFGLLSPEGAMALGASGAVLGITTAWCLIWPEREVLMFFVVPMKAKHLLWIMAGLELLFAWMPGNGVANFAHLGGMLTAYVWLKHARGVLRAPGQLSVWLSDLSRKRKRKRFTVLDDEIERWMKDDEDRTTRH